MFTGIIEETGVVKSIRNENQNVVFEIACSFVQELKIDQSISHNGCCLSVSALNTDTYEVTAVQETLQVTNLGSVSVSDRINLETIITSWR